MDRLELKQDGDWITFSSTNKMFINCVRVGITPQSFRRYNSAQRRWLVYHTSGKALVNIAKKFYVVDRSNLPSAWQLLMAGGAARAPVPTNPPVSGPYRALFLLEDAPMSVVKAVYRVLLHEYHPDTNNGVCNQSRFDEVTTAYRKILSMNKK